MKNYKLDSFADSHIHMSILDFKTCENYLDLLATQGVTDVTIHALTYRALAYNLSNL